MCSCGDRIRAVKLYLKLGKRLRATIRQLGYPTKNSLIGWYREYEWSQNLRVGYLWAYAPGAFETTRAVVYEFCESRAGEHARDFLGDWKGSLVCDDYVGYKQGLAQGLTEVGYLNDVLTRLPTHMASRIDELLPHRWQPAHI